MSNKDQNKCNHKHWIILRTHDDMVECGDCGLRLSNANMLSYKNIQYQKTFQKWFNVVTLIIAMGAIVTSIWIANISPKWQVEQEINDQIISLYRNIIANEDIFIANDYRDFVKNPKVINLPEPYIDYQISGKVHEILQRELGIVNYRYLLYYLNKISLLDNLREKLSMELIAYGNNSSSFNDTLKTYSEFSAELGESEGWEKKFNVMNDTGCLLYLFQKTFDFIIIDKRDESVSCSSESLNRIFYHFGYLPGNAPDWFEEELRQAVKEMRGINI